jgi:hypothetical protein
MKQNKKIYNYLDKQMDEEEYNRFNLELKSNSKLKNEFEAVKANLSAVKNLSDMNEELPYFNNLYARLDKTKIKKSNEIVIARYGMAFSALVILTFTFVLFSYLYNFKQSTGVQYAAEQLSQEEADDLTQLINIYLPEKTANLDITFTESDESAINSKLYEELDLADDKVKRSLFDTSSDMEKLLADLGEKEFEKIYSELSNKKIL